MCECLINSTIKSVVTHNSKVISIIVRNQIFSEFSLILTKVSGPPQPDSLSNRLVNLIDP